MTLGNSYREKAHASSTICFANSPPSPTGEGSERRGLGHRNIPYGRFFFRPPCCLKIFRFSGISKQREISLPPGGRWILRSKRRKEPARALFSSHQRLQNKATRALLQSPTAPALVATRSLLGSDSPPDCHSIPRSRFATSRREPSRVPARVTFCKIFGFRG